MSTQNDSLAALADTWDARARTALPQDAMLINRQTRELRESLAFAFAAKAPDGFVLMPASLTAENGAKAALLGEYSVRFEAPCPECDGEGVEGCATCDVAGTVIDERDIDWTTIKAIYSAAVAHFATTSTEQTGSRASRDARNPKLGAAGVLLRLRIRMYESLSISERAALDLAAADLNRAARQESQS